MLSFRIQDTAVMCNFIAVYENDSAKCWCFGNCEITYPLNTMMIHEFPLS